MDSLQIDFSRSDHYHIVIADGVTSIGDGALSDCKKLRSITIPKSVASIGRDAFYGRYKLTIHALSGSTAEKFAIKNKIPFTAE